MILRRGWLLDPSAGASERVTSGTESHLSAINPVGILGEDPIWLILNP